MRPVVRTAVVATALAALVGAASASRAEAQAPNVEDLSLVEVPAAATAPASDTFAIFLTGDGGWAELDRAVAARLAARGIPVVGWSTLGYYWTPRTPDGAAADLSRVIAHYTAAWQRPRAILVGYSFGADVAPFLVNRLPPADRATLASVVLLAPSDSATFEFRVGQWIGRASPDQQPTRPELARLEVPTICVTPAGDDTPCGSLAPRVRIVGAAAGHHFGRDYTRLATLVAASVTPAAPTPPGAGAARPAPTGAPPPWPRAAPAPRRAARRASSAAP